MKNKRHLPDFITLAIIIIGIALRIYVFIKGRPFDWDESHMVNDIINSAFLRTNSSSVSLLPFGFAMLQQDLVFFLGKEEWVFRLVPFLASVFFMPGYYFFVKRFSDDLYTMRISMVMAAFSSFILFYAVCAKQYALDPLFMIIISMMLKHIEEHDSDMNLLLVVFLSVLSSFFVFSGIFIALVTLVYLLIILREKRQIIFVLSFYLVCLLVCLPYLLLYLDKKYIVDPLREMWVNMGGLPPMEPGFWVYWRWAVSALNSFCTDVIGLPMVLIGPAVVYGAMICYRKAPRNLVLLLGPGLLIFVAASFYFYPFNQRLVFVALPGILFLAAAGISSFLERYFTNNGIRFFLIILFVVTVSSNHFKRDHESPEKVLRFVAENHVKGDAVLADFWIYRLCWYYESRYDLDIKCLNIPWMVLSRGADGKFYCPRNNYTKEILQPLVKYERIWFILPAIDKYFPQHREYIMYFFKNFPIFEYNIADDLVLMVDLRKAHAKKYRCMWSEQDSNRAEEISIIKKKAVDEIRSIHAAGRYFRDKRYRRYRNYNLYSLLNSQFVNFMLE